MTLKHYLFSPTGCLACEQTCLKCTKLVEKYDSWSENYQRKVCAALSNIFRKKYVGNKGLKLVTGLNHAGPSASITDQCMFSGSIKGDLEG